MRVRPPVDYSRPPQKRHTAVVSVRVRIRVRVRVWAGIRVRYVFEC